MLKKRDKRLAGEGLKDSQLYGGWRKTKLWTQVLLSALFLFHIASEKFGFDDYAWVDWVEVVGLAMVGLGVIVSLRRMSRRQCWKTIAVYSLIAGVAMLVTLGVITITNPTTDANRESRMVVMAIGGALLVVGLAALFVWRHHHRSLQEHLAVHSLRRKRRKL